MSMWFIRTHNPECERCADNRSRTARSSRAGRSSGSARPPEYERRGSARHVAEQHTRHVPERLNAQMDNCDPFHQRPAAPRDVCLDQRANWNCAHVAHRHTLVPEPAPMSSRLELIGKPPLSSGIALQYTPVNSTQRSHISRLPVHILVKVTLAGECFSTHWRNAQSEQ